MNSFEDVETTTETDETTDHPAIKKLKQELQCPVCDQIPSSLPIPCCPSGHILCKECKQRIPFNRRIGDQPCPVCRSPLDGNTSYLAGTLISTFTDIPCSNKVSGCSFKGTLEDIKDHHPCEFKMVVCFVCHAKCTRKDFFNHNNQDCFLKDAMNTFSFPTKKCFYLVQDNKTGQNVLVDVWFAGKADEDGDEDEYENVVEDGDVDDDDMFGCVGIGSFRVKPFNHQFPGKLKIRVCHKLKKFSMNCGTGGF